MKSFATEFCRLELVHGDILDETVEGIVNSANERLGGGFGVDEAIHKAAGIDLLDQCMSFPEIRPEVRCPTGQSVTTGPALLHCRKVIHTVGPDWRGGHGSEAKLLKSAHKTALAEAVKHDLKSIAFPAISCGIFGYPVDQAAVIALSTVIEFMQQPSCVKLIRYVLFSEDDYQQFCHALDQVMANN